MYFYTIRSVTLARFARRGPVIDAARQLICCIVLSRFWMQMARCLALFKNAQLEPEKTRLG